MTATPQTRTRLPERDEIDAMTNLAQVLALEDQVLQSTTKIETDLDFRSGTADWEARARGALTAHQVCLKRIRTRISYLRGGKKGSDPVALVAVQRAKAERATAHTEQQALGAERRRLRLEKQGITTQERIALAHEKSRRRILDVLDRTAFGSIFINVARETLSADVIADLIVRSVDQAQQNLKDADQIIVEADA